MSDTVFPGWFQRHHESVHERLDKIDHTQTLILKALEGLIQMSTSLSAQLDAATAAIQADVAAVSTEVSTLIAELTPGSTITQAQIDKLTAIDASLKAIPAAPAPTPPATPTP